MEKRRKGRPNKKEEDKISAFYVYFKNSTIAENGGVKEFRSKIQQTFKK